MFTAVLVTALAFAGIAAAQPVQQPQPPEQPQATPQPPAPLSERQQDRIAQQERLIACNRQGRESGLRGAQRQNFVRDCLKSDNAAAGGGPQK